MTRRTEAKGRAGSKLEDAIVLSSSETSSRESSPQPVSARRHVISSQGVTAPSTLGKRSLSRKTQSDASAALASRQKSKKNGLRGGMHERSIDLSISTDSSQRASSDGAVQPRPAQDDDWNDDFFNRRKMTQASRLSARPSQGSPQNYTAGMSSQESESDSDSAWSVEGLRARKRRAMQSSSWLQRLNQKGVEEKTKGDEESNVGGSHSSSSQSGTEKDELAEVVSSDEDGETRNRPMQGTRSREAKKKRLRTVSLTPPPPLGKDAEAALEEMLHHLSASEREDSETGGEEDKSSPKTIRHRALKNQRQRNGSSQEGGVGGPNDASSKANSSSSTANDIHPDLANIYRGEEAADIRKRAEEERKKRDAERAARQEALEAERRKREMEKRERLEKARLSRPKDDEITTILSDSDVDAHSKSQPQLKPAASPRPSASKQSNVIDIADSSTEDENETESVSKRSNGSGGVQESSTQRQVSPPAVPADEGPLISLTLRTDIGQPIPVTVKRTTAIKNMLNHFFSHFSESQLPLNRRAKVKLTWDGEAVDLNGTIGDVQDIDDEDVLDVTFPG